MNDLSKEKLEPLSVLARRIPNRRGGMGINVCTPYRWATVGVRGEVLETILLGGTRFSSVEAFERFLAKINGKPTALVPTRTNRERSSAIAKANAELRKAGF